MERDDFEELLQTHRANCEKIHALQFSIRQLTEMQDNLLRENFVLLERLMEETRATRARERSRSRAHEREREREREREGRRTGRARWNRLYYLAQEELSNQQPRPSPPSPLEPTTLSSLFAAVTPPLVSTSAAAASSSSSAANNSSAARGTTAGGEQHDPSNLMFEYDIPLSQINNFMQMIQNLGEPVEVPLTTAEIEAATRTASYSSIVAPQNTTCPIQLDAFQDDDVVMMIRGCGHLFHRDALMHWFQRNHRCPMCRMDIRERT